MTISGGIYFLGRYRPAYFEGETPFLVSQKMLRAIRFLDETDLRLWLAVRIEFGRAQLGPSCTTWQAEHCDRGVCFATRPHDPFLDRVTATMPDCPGLDYSGACNA